MVNHGKELGRVLKMSLKLRKELTLLSSGACGATC